MHHTCTHMHQAYTYTHTLYAHESLVQMHLVHPQAHYTYVHTPSCASIPTHVHAVHTCVTSTSLHLHVYSPVSCSWPCYLFTYFHILTMLEMFLSISTIPPTHLHLVEQNSYPLLSRADPLFTKGQTRLQTTQSMSTGWIQLS